MFSWGDSGRDSRLRSAAFGPQSPKFGEALRAEDSRSSAEVTGGLDRVINDGELWRALRIIEKKPLCTVQYMLCRFLSLNSRINVRSTRGGFLRGDIQQWHLQTIINPADRERSVGCQKIESYKRYRQSLHEILESRSTTSSPRI